MEPEAERPEPVPPRGRPGGGAIWIGALVLLAVAGGILVWLLVRGGESERSRDREQEQAAVRTVSAEELDEFAAAEDGPVYWLGPRAGSTYELTRTSDGRISIRYLPEGREAGGESRAHLSVETSPQDDAFEALRTAAERQGVETVELEGGGLAFEDASRPTNAYAAFPDADYQVEVYDPEPGRALELLRSGALVRLGEQPRAPATRASPARLRALAGEVGHPIYWVGPEPEFTYELTQTSGGVYVRYLPPDARLGDPRPDFLTVGTSPRANALEELRKRAEQADAETIELPGGGLASVDPDRPTSVYLAFPDGDVEVEVYDPDPDRARQLVEAGRVAPVG